MFDDELLSRRRRPRPRPGALRIFWDVDAPATLERDAGRPRPPAAGALPDLDLVLTYGGGDRRWSTPIAGFGARACVPIYNALDPATHHPVAAGRRASTADLALPRQPPARPRGAGRGVLPRRRRGAARTRRFLLGGNGWDDKADAAQRRATLGHVCTADHNAFNARRSPCSTSRATAWRAIGFSPATRVFEAAGAAACLITDAWEGIELFLEPGRRGAGRARRAGRRRAARGADARAAPARSARRRAGAGPGRAHLCPPRGAQVDGSLPSVRRRRGRVSGPAEARRPRPQSIARPGATATRPPTARCCAPSPRAATTSCSSSATCPGTPAHRDLPTPELLRARALRRPGRPRRMARRGVAAADAVIVGSYVPDGVAVGDVGPARRRAASRAFYDIDTPVTLAKLARGDARLSLARADPRLRPLSLLHRRPDAASGSSGATARRRPARSTARSIPQAYRPLGRARRAGISATSAPTAPTASRRWSGCCSSPPARCPDCASSSPARSTRRHRLAGQRRAARPRAARPTIRPSTRASRFTLNVTRADMIAAGLVARACGCSRPPPAARRSSPTAGRGSTTLFEPGREILLADDGPRCSPPDRDEQAERAEIAGGARRCWRSTRPPGGPRSSRSSSSAPCAGGDVTRRVGGGRR